MKRSRFLCVFLCVTALAAGIAMMPLVASAQSKAGETKTLDIGMLLSVTGFFSSREVPDYNETQIAADMINEKGGIVVNGEKYKVRLLLEDCKSTMDGVTAAANRLVHEKKVKFILGPTAFFASAAALSWTPRKCSGCSPIRPITRVNATRRHRMLSSAPMQPWQTPSPPPST